MNNKIYKCPYCEKCCAVYDECHECISISIHKSKPPPRQYTLRTLAKRRCAKCKRDFIVECHASVSVLLRWLIFNDPYALAREIFMDNSDLVKKLQQDEKFMDLITKE